MQVCPIVEEVRARGDAAVRSFTEKYDKVQLTSVCVRIEVSTGGRKSTKEDSESMAAASTHNGKVQAVCVAVGPCRAGVG